MAEQTHTAPPARKKDAAERCGKPVDPDFPCHLDPKHPGKCRPKP